MRLKEKNLLQKFAATLKKFSAQGAKKVEYGMLCNCIVAGPCKQLRHTAMPRLYGDTPSSSVLGIMLNLSISQVRASYLKLGDVLFRFSGFREKFKLDTFVYMVYTFKILCQLKIGRSLSL